MEKSKTVIFYILIIIGLSLRYVAYAGVTSNDVLVSKDIEFRQVPNYLGKIQSLRLDAYQQLKSSNTNRPVIILVHGGGFSSGDKGFTESQENFYPEMAKELARQGYVVFSINYRLWPNFPIDSFHIELNNAISDVLAAVIWIKGKKSEYSIDTSKIIICGDSAGGGLAINTSYCNAGLFVGCIDLWGGLPPYGIHENKDLPVNTCAISNKTPPTCMIHGTADTVAPFSNSEELSGSLTKAGIYNELHPLKGANHYAIEYTDEIIPIMIAFANKIVKNEVEK